MRTSHLLVGPVRGHFADFLHELQPLPFPVLSCSILTAHHSLTLSWFCGRTSSLSLDHGLQWDKDELSCSLPSMPSCHGTTSKHFSSIALALLSNLLTTWQANDFFQTNLAICSTLSSLMSVFPGRYLWGSHTFRWPTKLREVWSFPFLATSVTPCSLSLPLWRWPLRTWNTFSEPACFFLPPHPSCGFFLLISAFL